MFDSFWRTLRKYNLGPRGAEKRAKKRAESCRPRLEALEDRVTPTLWPGMTPPVAAPPPPPPPAMAPSASFSNLQTVATPPAGSANQMMMTVMENSPESVINLDLVFAEMSGLPHEEGLQLALLGNTNSGLVSAELSDTDLTLQYAPGRYGLSTITVGATDADGVSMQESILVMVVPPDVESMTAAPPSGASV